MNVSQLWSQNQTNAAVWQAQAQAQLQAQPQVTHRDEREGEWIAAAIQQGVERALYTQQQQQLHMQQMQQQVPPPAPSPSIDMGILIAMSILALCLLAGIAVALGGIRRSIDSATQVMMWASMMRLMR